MNKFKINIKYGPKHLKLHKNFVVESQDAETAKKWADIQKSYIDVDGHTPNFVVEISELKD